MAGKRFQDVSHCTSNSRKLSSENETRTILPTTVNFWNKSNLLDLNITPCFCPNQSPMDIVDLLNPICRITPTILTLRDRAKIISEVLKRKCIGFAYILDKELEDLSTDTTYELLTESNLWAVKTLEKQNESEWAARFQSYTEDFSRWLHDTVQQLEDDTEIPDHMLQFLFDYFVHMFGLKSLPSPCIQSKSMAIRESVISGGADLLYRSPSPPVPGSSKDRTVLSVCDVKKTFDVSLEPSPKKIRKTSASSVMGTVTSSNQEGDHDQSQMSSHISDALLGQHCGNLLLYFPFSVRDHMIMGMIVQKTCVTFTALCLSRHQYEQLKNGTLKLDKENGPRFLYTKPYNYLRKKDREDLIEPLVFLGLLQSEKTLTCVK